MAFKYNPFLKGFDYYQLGKAIQNVVTKNADFTGVAGEMYLVTTGNATITMTMPSATAGDFILVKIADDTASGVVVSSPVTESLDIYNSSMLYVYNGSAWETLLIDAGYLDQYEMWARTSPGSGRREKVQMVQEWITAPSTLTDPGFVGQKATSDNFLFFCYLLDTWAKVPRIHPTPATITVDTVLTDFYTFVKVDDTAATVELTLPTAVGKDTKAIVIKKVAGANQVDIVPNGLETIV
jgi:hypothetical protein